MRQATAFPVSRTPQAGRLNLGIVGLAMLAGGTMSMGFVQLLTTPLETVSNLSVQVLAVQATTLAAPMVISLLLVLRDGPELTLRSNRLTQRCGITPWQLWRQQAQPMLITAVMLVPYLVTAALIAAVLTKPELSSLVELQFLVGNLNPEILLTCLLKAPLFAALILWITLQQGAMAHRQRRRLTSAVSRAISVSLAVVLGLDLVWTLLLTPSLGGA